MEKMYSSKTQMEELFQILENSLYFVFYNLFLILLSYSKKVLVLICVTEVLLLVKSMIQSFINNLFWGSENYTL